MTKEYFENINEFKKKHRLIYSHYDLSGIHGKYVAIFFGYAVIMLSILAYLNFTIWYEGADEICSGTVAIIGIVISLFVLPRMTYYIKHMWLYIFDDGIAMFTSPKVYRKIKKGYEYLPFEDVSDIEFKSFKKDEVNMYVIKKDGQKWRQPIRLCIKQKGIRKRENVYIEKMQEAWHNWKNNEIPEEIKEESTGKDYYKKYEKYWKILVGSMMLYVIIALIHSLM